MRNAVAICAAGFPGAATALGELADATGLIHCVTLRLASTRTVEAQFVRSLLAGGRTRLLILGGWSRAYEPFLALASRAGIPVATYWTSTCGQTGLSDEIERLAACLDDRRVTHRWFIQRALAAVLGRRLDGCAWLPAVVSHPGRRSFRGAREAASARPAGRGSGRVAEIGMFCSPHEYARKNVLTVLTAIARLDRPIRLHLNGLSRDRAYSAWLNRLGIDRVDHGWMTRDRYFEVVGQLDLGVQVSFAESFNYVAADHVLAGVPIVVSPMVASIADLPAAVSRPFIVSNADDPEAVALVMSRLLDQPRSARRRTADLRTALVAAQRASLARARRLVRKAVDAG